MRTSRAPWRVRKRPPRGQRMSACHEATWRRQAVRPPLPERSTGHRYLGMRGPRVMPGSRELRTLSIAIDLRQWLLAIEFVEDAPDPLDQIVVRKTTRLGCAQQGRELVAMMPGRECRPVSQLQPQAPGLVQSIGPHQKEREVMRRSPQLQAVAGVDEYA